MSRLLQGMVADQETPGMRGAAREKLKRLLQVVEIDDAISPVHPTLYSACAVDSCDPHHTCADFHDPIHDIDALHEAGVAIERRDDAGGQVKDRRIVIAGRDDRGEAKLVEPLTRRLEFAAPAALRDVSRNDDGFRLDVLGELLNSLECSGVF